MAAESAKRRAETEAAEEARPYLDAQAVKALCNRLARLEGHVRFVRAMVQEQRCADEILLQAAAAKAALNQFCAVLLDQELNACLTGCMRGEAEERLAKVSKVLSTLLKHS